MTVDELQVRGPLLESQQRLALAQQDRVDEEMELVDEAEFVEGGDEAEASAIESSGPAT